MNIPSIPTDNLYKFMAIAGIVILILIGILYTTKIESLESEDRRLEDEIDILEVDEVMLISKQVWLMDTYISKIVDILNEDTIPNDTIYHKIIADIKLNLEDFRRLVERGKRKNFDSILILNIKILELEKDFISTLNYEVDQIDEEYLFERTYEVSKNLRLFNNKVIQYEKNVLKIKLLKHNLKMLAIIGILLASFGFYLWYFKVQIYQDVILKETALKYKENMDVEFLSIRRIIYRFSPNVLLAIIFVLLFKGWWLLGFGIIIVVGTAFEIISFKKEKNKILQKKKSKSNL